MDRFTPTYSRCDSASCCRQCFFGFYRQLYKVFGLGLCLFFSAQAIAQPYGNEWIDYSRTYFKIRVTENGFYRIDFNQLSQALAQSGLSISQIPRRSYQIHYRGKEQAIYVPGQASLPLTTTDFIEFYGKRNDAAQDSLLYYRPEALVNPFYAIHSDTSAYFLSVNPNPLAIGKRVGNPALNSNFLAPVKSIVREERIRLFVDQNVRGAQYPFLGGSIKPRRSLWEMSEGWYGEAIVFNGATGLFSFDSVIGYSPLLASVVPQLEVALVGESGSITYGFDILVGPSSNPADLRVAGSGSITSYDKRVLNLSLLPTDVSANGRLFVRVQNKTPGSSMRLSWCRLNYPAATGAMPLTDRWIVLEPENSSPFESQLVLTTFPSQPLLFEEINPDSLVIRAVSVAAGQLRVVLPQNTFGKKLWLRNANQFKPVTSLQPIRFRNLSLLSPDFLIFSHPLYRLQAGGFVDPVAAYASYRASTAGGGFDTLCLHFSEVQDAFAFGEYNPVAIMKALKYLHRNGGMRYVLIIGKGYGLIPRSDTFALARNYIPAVGLPGSDQIYGFNLSGQNLDSMEIAIGRLAAINAQEVVNYLQKVIEHESRNPLQAWHKNLLHLSGGNNLSEIEAFSQFMKAYEQKAIDTLLGARVRSRTKQSTLNVEFINIAEQINAGQLMVNIFAHSSISFIDIDVGNVNDPINGYANTGRYPFFLISGCNSGGIFGGQRSWGEPWVMTANKGAIAFLAHSDLGYSFSSDQYNRIFYDSAFRSNRLFGAAIGDLVLAAGNRILQFTDPATIESGAYVYYRAHAEQTTLQGDPAVRLFPLTRPDYAFSGSGPELSTFDGSRANAGKDSLLLLIPVRNWGKAPSDSLELEVERKLQGQSLAEVIRFKTARILREDTLKVTIRQLKNVWAGLNQFTIRLDPDNLIQESNETNNLANLNIALPAGGALAVQPSEFSFSGSKVASLVAVSGSGLEQAEDFYFEWDTVPSFQSLAKRDTLIMAKTLANWDIDLTNYSLNLDTLLVFWRVQLRNTTQGVDTSFSQSSFAYMAGNQQGWSQRGLGQLSKNGFNNLSRNPLTGSIDFASVQTEISLRVAGGGLPSNLDSILVKVNQDLIIPSLVAPDGPCSPNSLLFIAFNKNNALPYQAFNLGPVPCGKPPGLAVDVTLNEANNSSKIQDFLDELQPGDPVFILSYGSFNYPALNSNARNALAGIGLAFQAPDSWQTGWPVLIQSSKGALSGPAQIFLPDTTSAIAPVNQMIDLQLTLIGKREQGYMTSPWIGPSILWVSLSHETFLQSSDELKVEVEAQDTSGVVHVLIPEANSPESLSVISSQQYPRLRLKWNIRDSLLLTAPLHRQWLISHTLPPDGLAFLQSTAAEKLPEGKTYLMKIGFKNISASPFVDSLLLVKYIWRNSSRGELVSWDSLTAPEPGNTLNIERHWPTRGFTGENNLEIQVNPQIQPELDYANNIQNIKVQVDVDQRHPLLDVLADGKKLLQGDLVSPKVEFLIDVQDDNPFLPLTDTGSVELLHKRPCPSCGFQLVNYQPGILEARPAGSTQRMQVAYKPSKLEDGLHTLAIQAKDASGNPSGTVPYSISFEVQNETSITHFFPYPNPFSDACRFVFTLTGSEVPDQFMIRVMTVSGRIVKEISLAEFGPIRLGHNQSQFVWNGMDEYGDRLANGVYLYKVFAKINGQEIKHRSSAADQGFNKGWGKMYILR